MKDPLDTVTHELPIKAKRGRPPTGTAKSAAERKREQRLRDRHAAREVDLTSMTTTALATELAWFASNGHVASAEKYAAELVRRAKEAKA